MKQLDTAVGITLIYQITDVDIRKILGAEMPDEKYEISGVNVKVKT